MFIEPAVEELEVEELEVEALEAEGLEAEGLAAEGLLAALVCLVSVFWSLLLFMVPACSGVSVLVTV